MTEDDFIVIDDVPILDEHTQEEEYDEPTLKRMVAVNNARIADTGDYSPITIGHTLEGEVPEEKQPRVVGFAGPYKLGTFGKTNPRPTIFARFRIYKKDYEVVKQFPRRSIELWGDDLVIDPIALLGASTPKRDLSLLFAKKYRKPTTYAKGDNMAEEKETDKPDKMARIMKAFKEFSKLFSEINDGEPDLDKDLKPEKAEADDIDKQEPPEEKMAEDDEDFKKKKGKRCNEEDSEPDKYRRERDQARADLVKYQREAKENKEQLDQLARKFRAAERERDLIQLRNEGFEFDLQDELTECLDLPVTTYTKHLDRIRKRYSRSLSSIPQLDVARINDGGLGRDFSHEDMMAAVKLAQGGKDYVAAVNEIKNGRMK